MFTYSSVQRYLICSCLNGLWSCRYFIKKQHIYHIITIIHLKYLWLQPDGEGLFCISRRYSSKINRIKKEQSYICYYSFLFGKNDISSTQKTTWKNVSSAIKLCFNVLIKGLPLWLNGKESASNAGDWDLIPGLGRSPGEDNGNPLQYSYLENPMDRGAWKAIVHRVAKSQTWLKWLNTYVLINKGKVSQN